MLLSSSFPVVHMHGIFISLCMHAQFLLTLRTNIEVRKIKSKFVLFKFHVPELVLHLFAAYPRSNVMIKHIGNTCNCSAVGRVCRRADSLRLLCNAYIL